MHKILLNSKPKVYALAEEAYDSVHIIIPHISLETLEANNVLVLNPILNDNEEIYEGRG